jgi:hypothetical protein
VLSESPGERNANVRLYGVHVLARRWFVEYDGLNVESASHKKMTQSVESFRNGIWIHRSPFVDALRAACPATDRHA